VREPARLERLPAAIVTPHAGYRYSGACAAHAYQALDNETGRRIRRVLLLAPSHYAAVQGVSVAPYEAYQTPLGRVPVDRDAARALLKRAGFQTVPAAHREEHSDEIQLPFLQVVLERDWKLVDLVVQGTEPGDWDRIAEALQEHVDEATLIVASTDFTHYGFRFGYAPFTDDVPENLRRLDLGAAEHALRLDPEGWAAYKRKTGITACGFEPVGIVLTLLKRIAAAEELKFEGRMLDYYRSGDLNGDFSTSVSYVAMLFHPEARPGSSEAAVPGESAALHPSSGPRPREALTAAEQEFLLETARRTLVEYLKTHDMPPVELPAELRGGPLEEKRGAFVTLRVGERLRGCIGNIIAKDPLVHGVRRNAVQSGFQDPRFPPLSPEELHRLQIEISVLTPLKAVGGPGDIVLGRDGILLERGPARAVFLPQVATEQNWDLPTTLQHLSMKAGLSPEAWKDPGTRFHVFQAQVFKEQI
ncbi:MAG: AmmeMemoRadiSam system protein B, partial [Candidatus Eisenbacteria bacterium]|nr:AmmeMemoRadiSam system protein B [Candidatus Eisenbacteria bacterium]